jgi:hypothetical protein
LREPVTAARRACTGERASSASSPVAPDSACTRPARNRSRSSGDPSASARSVARTRCAMGVDSGCPPAFAAREAARTACSRAALSARSASCGAGTITFDDG